MMVEKPMIGSLIGGRVMGFFLSVGILFSAPGPAAGAVDGIFTSIRPVSYTHLTLPTICSV